MMSQPIITDRNDVTKDEYKQLIKYLREKYRKDFQDEKGRAAFVNKSDSVTIFCLEYVEWLEDAVFEAYEHLPI